jgi:hypothetical protein
MSSVPRAIWDNTYGLLVDDGQLAVGILASLAIAWAVATYGTGTLRSFAGWLLLGLLLALVLANLYRAGLNARRRAIAR